MWELEISGVAASVAVEAGIIVANARRARIAISEWSPEFDKHAASILNLLLAHLFRHDKALEATPKTVHLSLVVGPR